MADDRTTAYAEALFAVAKAEGPLAEVSDELFRIAQVIKGNDELRDTLADPHIPTATRLQVIEDILDGKATPATVSLVSMVTANGRIRDLPAIVDEFVGQAGRHQFTEVQVLLGPNAQRGALPDVVPEQVAGGDVGDAQFLGQLDRLGPLPRPRRAQQDDSHLRNPS